jgi:hypothetical protein
MSRAQKTPLSRSLPTFAQKKALDEIAKRGLALPGHVVAVTGAIVTVNFDLLDVTLQKVTMPLFGPEYIRYPVQVGDKGVAFPASVYLGGVSGLGGGTADLTMRGNLSTLVWFPIGNKNWTAPPGADANTLTLYGKTALELLDSIAGNGSIKMTSSSITLACGGHTIVINSTGVVIDGRPFLSHIHLPGAYVAGSTPVTNDSGAVF